jgi:hypothetical protein
VSPQSSDAYLYAKLVEWHLQVSSLGSRIAYTKIEHPRARILTSAEAAVFTQFPRFVRNWLGITFPHLSPNQENTRVIFGVFI